ncbi:MAG TPA: hypothetical protein VK886_00280 [Vicinamibacterales bacterium]|nr:hypothetical protein [Vicinamibacterales bacterium]
MALLALLTACAPKLKVPEMTGPPLTNFTGAYEEATAGCTRVRSVTAELGLSGRAGRTRIRGRALVGLVAPDAVRIEGIAPFGPPAFILVSTQENATLLLPRDNRVLRHGRPDEIVEALAGVRIDPAGLIAAISGCGLPPADPSGSRTAGNDWASVTTASGEVAMRREGGRWRVRSASRGGLTIRYDELGPTFPARVTLIVPGQGSDVVAEVAMRVSQLETNVDLGPEAFAVEIPADADPLTLAELREAGPLGEKR